MERLLTRFLKELILGDMVMQFYACKRGLCYLAIGTSLTKGAGAPFYMRGRGSVQRSGPGTRELVLNE